MILLKMVNGAGSYEVVATRYSIPSAIGFRFGISAALRSAQIPKHTNGVKSRSQDDLRKFLAYQALPRKPADVSGQCALVTLTTNMPWQMFATWFADHPVTRLFVGSYNCLSARMVTGSISMAGGNYELAGIPGSCL